MTERRKEARGQSGKRAADSPHAGFKLRHTLRGHAGWVYRMALSPDGRILASPSSDKTVRLWDTESGRILRTLEHQAGVTSVGWSPDGTRLAVGGGYQDRKVYLWDAATGRRTWILEEQNTLLTGVAWSPDGKTLASCSEDGVRLCDAVSGRVLRELKGHSNRVESVVWSPEGKRLCSGS
jgi:WD40 repeat protein